MKTVLYWVWIIFALAFLGAAFAKIHAAYTVMDSLKGIALVAVAGLGVWRAKVYSK